MYPSRAYSMNIINSTIIYLKDNGTPYYAKLEGIKNSLKFSDNCFSIFKRHDPIFPEFKSCYAGSMYQIQLVQSLIRRHSICHFFFSISDTNGFGIDGFYSSKSFCHVSPSLIDFYTKNDFIVIFHTNNDIDLVFIHAFFLAMGFCSIRKNSVYAFIFCLFNDEFLNFLTVFYYTLVYGTG